MAKSTKSKPKGKGKKKKSAKVVPDRISELRAAGKDFDSKGKVEEVPEKLKEKEETDLVEEKVKGDYLLKYQYGKNLPLGDPRTNPSKGSKSERMKNQLLDQPKVSIFIPRGQAESPSIKLSVCLNGYRLDLPKQTYLTLPKQIAEVIMTSQKQTVEAGRPFLISRDEKTEEALS